MKKIPRGKTLSYKEVATAVGSPGAYRAVGSALKMNFDRDVPCHRVIKSDGAAGGYNGGGTSKKMEMLKREGVNLKKQRQGLR